MVKALYLEMVGQIVKSEWPENYIQQLCNSHTLNRVPCLVNRFST